MSSTEIFERALRAAAGVTGVLRRGAAIGVALAAAGCELPPTQPTPSNRPGATVARPAPIDAAVDAPTCDHDPGWGSPCCEAARAAGEMPGACQAWGPPAPPVYRGEVLA